MPGFDPPAPPAPPPAPEPVPPAGPTVIATPYAVSGGPELLTLLALELALLVLVVVASPLELEVTVVALDGAEEAPHAATATTAATAVSPRSAVTFDGGTFPSSFRSGSPQ